MRRKFLAIILAASFAFSSCEMLPDIQPFDVTNVMASTDVDGLAEIPLAQQKMSIKLKDGETYTVYAPASEAGTKPSLNQPFIDNKSMYYCFYDISMISTPGELLITVEEDYLPLKRLKLVKEGEIDITEDYAFKSGIYESDGIEYEMFYGLRRVSESTGIVVIGYCLVDDVNCGVINKSVVSTVQYKNPNKTASTSGESIENSYANSKYMYLPLGSTGYDVLVNTASKVTVTGSGYSVWFDKDRNASVVNMTVDSAADDYLHNALLKDGKCLEMLKNADQYKSLVVGGNFERTLNSDGTAIYTATMNYIDKQTQYLHAVVMVNGSSASIFVVKSYNAISEYFLRDNFRVVLSEERQTDEIMSKYPKCDGTQFDQEGYKPVIEINRDFLKNNSVVDEAYIKEKYGESVQISKDMLTTTLSLSGTTRTVTCPVAAELSNESPSIVYATLGKSAESTSLRYYIQEVTNRTVTSDITEEDIYGFSGVVESVQRNLKQSRTLYDEDTYVDEDIWTGVYQFSTISGGNQGTLNIYIKKMTPTIFFIAVLETMSGANESDLALMRKAMETTIGQ